MTGHRQVHTEQVVATEPLSLRQVRGSMTPKFTSEDERFRSALSAIPEGYATGHFWGKRWGTTKRTSVDGNRVWLFAEELGGRDIVSFNAYRLSGERWLVRPCEMSMAKVADFVQDFGLEASIR